VRRELVAVLGLATLAGALACAALRNADKDPAAATREAIKTAELACLSCALPNLPKPAQDACAKLEPICKGLAGVCEAE
jgi:hypothetical protein